MKAIAWTTAALAAALAAGTAWANGGPFVVKYPTGDPAAKGVMARLDPSLKPAREERLRVASEDLTLTFGGTGFRDASAMPLCRVTARYVIENPTDKPVTMDFGFPILRGLYMSPFAMMPVPDAQVQVQLLDLPEAANQQAPAKSPPPTTAHPQIISNSMLYGMIRQRAREAIEKAVAADAKLAALVAAVRPSADPAPNAQQRQGADPTVPDRSAARKALAGHLADTRKWNDRDVTLMVEYAGLTLGQRKSRPFDSPYFRNLSAGDRETAALAYANLGPLSAIGEQKATQLLATLAGKFDEKEAAGYEAIFSAWGGDVRERAVDLGTGELRPRELTVTGDPVKAAGIDPVHGGASDPTVYARVEYLDPQAKITDDERAACKAILKNLPVVFTFAPMNLLYYKVDFPAHARQAVTVSYSQYAYTDTKDPASYQFAYVLHPASMWKEFGPINLKVQVPANVACKASFALSTPVAMKAPPARTTPPVPYVAYEATLTEAKDKTGELFVGIDKTAFDQAFAKPGAKTAETPTPVPPGTRVAAKKN
jgi:hypothetical protein